MKKLLLFLIFLHLLSCTSTINKNEEFVNIDCPLVFFSKENNSFYKGNKNSFELEDVEYIATLNNYSFNKPCLKNKKINYFSIDLLILVEQINQIDNPLELPLFVILYDEKRNVIERQYFKIKTNLFSYEITDVNLIELVENIDIVLNSKEQTSFVAFGFVNIK